ncbi:longitudinals lacking protein, isoforms N/O/W/X/Y isoform X1 [Hetaerina americana]|uniref:longitudinals lacking protein, isoforms N/O/W/X/Y isoform X1 n=1 Tax=Hetaerina americana TaxID=62018 RepID=UPI003A7F41BF
MNVQQFCLRWNNHQPNFVSVFTNLLNNESLVDVTLAAEGRQLRAHRVVLSACSSYFQNLFAANPCQHPIVILKDVKFSDLKTMVDFMYYGEVNVSQDQLPSILKTAEMLMIKGLADLPNIHKGGGVIETAAMLVKHEASAANIGGDTQTWISTADPHIRSGSPSRTSSLTPSILRRKRLRKNSTGSGSTDRTSEDAGTDLHGESSPTSCKAPLCTERSGSFGPGETETTGGLSSGGGSLRNSIQGTSTDSESGPPRNSSQEGDTMNLTPTHGSSSDVGDGGGNSMMEEPGVSGASSSGLGVQDMCKLPEERKAKILALLQKTSVHNHESLQETCALVTDAIALDTQATDSKEHQDIPEEQNDQASSPPPLLKPRRGRLLIRQPRIKKETDPLTYQPSSSPDSDSPSSPHYSSNSSMTQLLQIPPRIERQHSEPLPSSSLHMSSLKSAAYFSSSAPSSSSQNLLQVPQPVFLQKQHSQPLLPSQYTQMRSVSPPKSSLQPSDNFSISPSTTLLLQRQISNPNTSGASACSVYQPNPPPIQLQLLPASSAETSETIHRRPCSPSIIVEQQQQLPLVRVIAESPSPESGMTSVIGGSTPKIRVKQEVKRAVSSPQTSSHEKKDDDSVGTEFRLKSLQEHQSHSGEDQQLLLRSVHCPALRPGPALGCNFCWNTVDDHGRILRRKTKYHCPECQTNLCIVPCFQEYHKKYEKPGTIQVTSVTSLCVKPLPKTSSI